MISTASLKAYKTRTRMKKFVRFWCARWFQLFASPQHCWFLLSSLYTHTHTYTLIGNNGIKYYLYASKELFIIPSTESICVQFGTLRVVRQCAPKHIPYLSKFRFRSDVCVGNRCVQAVESVVLSVVNNTRSIVSRVWGGGNNKNQNQNDKKRRFSGPFHIPFHF